MYLTIDIGNSFAKLAIFHDGEIVYKERHHKLLVGNVDKLYKKFLFSRAILSSTRVIDKRIITAIQRRYDMIILDHNTAIPIKNLYRTPETLGRDRLAAMVGAYVQYPKQNCVIIDLGTCNTFDLVDKNGTYQGGNISPGVDMKLKAMNHFTSKLSLPVRQYNDDPIGKDTTSALQNGAFWGTIFEIESFIHRMNALFTPLNVILTGGDAEIFGSKLNSKIFVAPNIVLIGLHEILKYNEE
ncbi:type III pantothenate kinase [Saprospiraceae bacterium]|jgi:type III pantothenate kinase|nr:type III pantothenate kinase [Saprospiraceae bacterium]MDA9333166.1 type III pantothenate kinase [Saprospiraceae bacterium]MDA9358314.1 type III pantothenate kinase [Saprospiraceae bacterium]MDB4162646.1 type III pantothenate kinase [Saprospiraceae bacterium]MDB4824778.1 type III pantothenate kinase [Saprospiraceae bacterium]